MPTWDHTRDQCHKARLMTRQMGICHVFPCLWIQCKLHKRGTMKYKEAYRLKRWSTGHVSHVHHGIDLVRNSQNSHHFPPVDDAIVPVFYKGALAFTSRQAFALTNQATKPKPRSYHNSPCMDYDHLQVRKTVWICFSVGLCLQTKKRKLTNSADAC